MDTETLKTTQGKVTNDERAKAKENKETGTLEEEQAKWEKATAERMHEITPGLMLGNLKSSYNRPLLRENHIDAIISLTSYSLSHWNVRTREAGVPETQHKWVQCADSPTQDILVYMSDICDFIDQVASASLHSLYALPATRSPGSALIPSSNRSSSTAVLIHCEMGYSRSPTVIIAYLMRKCGTGREETTRFVRSKQRIRPSPNFTRQLQVWEDVGYQVWEDAERKIPKASYQMFLDDRAALLKEKGLTGREPLWP